MDYQHSGTISVTLDICNYVAEIILCLGIKLGSLGYHKVALFKILAAVTFGRTTLHGVGLYGLDSVSENRRNTAGLRGQCQYSDQYRCYKHYDDQNINYRI